MAADRLGRLLDPASVAYVGGRRAALAAAQSDRLGYEGEVWLVNPNGPDASGRRRFADLGELPGVPDAVFVGVNAADATEIVRTAARLGAGGAVVYAAGFGETGPAGAARERELVAAAGTMPVIGPNCHGFVNATSGAALWPDVHGCARVERGVAIVTQSGNLAIDFSFQRRALPVAFAITLGNQAMVTVADCVAALAADERVSAIGLHIEGVADAAAFGTAVTVAADHDTPVVVLKTGETAAGARIASTHTASLVGDAAAHRALFAHYGVAQVRSADELLAALIWLHHHGRLRGPRLTSLSCSGGEAALVADLAAPRNVSFPPFPDEVAGRLAALLDHRVAVDNPLDYHTFIWGDRPRMTAVFAEALAASDAGMLVIDFPPAGLDDADWWPTIGAFADALDQSGTPGVVSSALPENLSGEVIARLAGLGLAAIPGIDTCLAAFAAARPRAVGGPHVVRSVAARHAVDEAAAKGRLRSAGLPVPAGRRAKLEGAASAAEEIGWPVVVKALAVDHRSEVGGVALALRDAASVTDAASAMAGLGDEVLVERMVEGVVGELLVGIAVDEPVGWTLTVGAGGVATEVMADVATVLLPTDAAALLDAFGSLRSYPLWDGYRGLRRAAIEVAVDVIVRLGVVAVEEGWELEINPLLMTADDVWIADVLMKELT